MISSGENVYAPAYLPVVASVHVHARCSLAISVVPIFITALLMAKEEAALSSLVALSPVLPWIALPVAFLLPTHRLEHENRPQYLLGAR